MKVYPDQDDSKRSQNPGPLPIDKVWDEPLVKDDDRPDLVCQLQKMLFELGYLIGPRSRFIDGVDGIFGPDTYAAVRKFQADNKDWTGTALAVDGEVGKYTGDALNRAMVGLWYEKYESVDNEGNGVPDDFPLVTQDVDQSLKTSAEAHEVALVYSGTPPDVGPLRSIHYMANDPQSDGSSHWGETKEASEYDRSLVKEAYLLNLHSSDALPKWTLWDTRGQKSPSPPGSTFPPPGRFPSDQVFSVPDNAKFQEGQAWVTIARTVRTWMMRGLAFSEWQGGGGSQTDTLDVTLMDPDANGKGFVNAGYSRPSEKRPFHVGAGYRVEYHLYTVNSAEVISHEVGHAILDAVYPTLWDGSLPLVVQAFHESFGDISAMLTTLSDPDVREKMLGDTGGEVDKTNLASKFAEEVGTVMFANRKDDDGKNNGAQFSLPDCGRDAVASNPEDNPNPPPQHFPFSFRDEKSLALSFAQGQDYSNTVISEAHNFSRVFTMAFYDSVANAYDRLLGGGGDSDAQDSALREAAGCMGKLLARAILRQPGDFGHFYKSVAKKMFEVDKALYGGEFRDDMKGSGDGNGFVGREILAESDLPS